MYTYLYIVIWFLGTYRLKPKFSFSRYLPDKTDNIRGQKTTIPWLLCCPAAGKTQGFHYIWRRFYFADARNRKVTTVFRVTYPASSVPDITGTGLHTSLKLETDLCAAFVQHGVKLLLRQSVPQATAIAPQCRHHHQDLPHSPCFTYKPKPEEKKKQNYKAGRGL